LEIDDSAWALADEERVLQIGRSLAVNALTHTPPGTEIVLTTALGAGRAELAVSDDGPGIPREHAQQVFDRFYRIEGPHASGSGLGLAIARQLAERMGGTVELSGAAERTTFTLSLPAAAVPAGELVTT